MHTKNITIFSILLYVIILGGCSGKPHKIAEKGDLEKLKKMLNNGLDINTQDTKGNTLLMSAVIGGNLPVIKYLLENGADVNIQNKRIGTPLHLAAAKGDVQIVEMLIEYGTDPNIKSNSMGETPLWLAVSWGKIEVVKVLLKHGADPNIETDWDYNLIDLSILAIANNRDLVDLFIKAGVNVNKQKKDGNTPLHTAVTSLCSDEIIILLLQNGADTTIKDNKGETALDLAKRLKYKTAIRLIEKHSVEKNN